MQLSDFLDFEAIRVDLSAGNKRQLLDQIAQIAAARLALDPSTIADSIAERERLGSTGFGGGVAIPHGEAGPPRSGLRPGNAACRARSIIRPSTASRSTSYSLLLSPPDAGAEHLKALAAVSRLVRHGGIVEKLRGARTRDAMAAVLIGAEERDAA